MTISSFKGDHRFLSNFWPAIVPYQNTVYSSVEHAYQAAKSYSDARRRQIKLAATAADAKRLGRKIPRHELSPYWDDAKLGVMRYLLEMKFSLINNSPLVDRLLATGDEELIEGNTWGDTFWGVCRGEGQNWLGRLLMERRNQLRAGA